MTDDYIISKEDFDQFAHQMVVTFPFMPKIVRDEWINRIDRVRGSSLSFELKKERERYADAILKIGASDDCPNPTCRRGNSNDVWGCVKCISESLRSEP